MVRIFIHTVLTEITYDQGSELIGHDFRTPLTEIEYRIVAKQRTSGNLMPNATLERIQQVLGNLVRTCSITQTYVEKYGPRSGILSALAFEVRSKTNQPKDYSPGQLIFGCDIIPINQTAD